MSTHGGSLAVSSIDLGQAYYERNGGYLSLDGGTTLLSLFSSTGDYIEVNGHVLNIPTDVTGFEITTDDTTDSDGADSTVTAQVSTLYYVYVANGASSWRPNCVHISTQAPQLAAGIWPACPYLKTTGNGRNLRYVGLAYVDAGTRFCDTPQQRFVINAYNRRPRSLYICPAYADANSDTTYVFNSATFTNVHANAFVQWLSTGQKDVADFGARLDFVDVSAHVVVSSTPAAVTQYGIGLDSQTQPSCAASIAASAANASVSARLVDVSQTVGLHTAWLLGVSNGNSTVVADRARSGAAADIAATYLRGWVLG